MGADGIVLTEHSSAQITNIFKYILWSYGNYKTSLIKKFIKTLDYLKKNGYWIYSLDMGGKEINDKFKFDKKSVLIVGNEKNRKKYP